MAHGLENKEVIEETVPALQDCLKILNNSAQSLRKCEQLVTGQFSSHACCKLQLVILHLQPVKATENAPQP